MERINNAIGGREVASNSGRVAAVYNPATGEQSAELGLSSAAEVADAIAVAKAASPEWEALGRARRGGVVVRPSRERAPAR